MEISGGVTDAGRTDDEQGKIGLLSLWMLDAEFRKSSISVCENVGKGGSVIAF